MHEAGEGGLAERTAKEAIAVQKRMGFRDMFLSNWTTLKAKGISWHRCQVSGFLTELQGDLGSMALVDFGGRSAANFEVP